MTKKKTYGTVFPEAVEAKLIAEVESTGKSPSDLIREAVAAFFGLEQEATQDRPQHGGKRIRPPKDVPAKPTKRKGKQ